MEDQVEQGKSPNRMVVQNIAPTFAEESLDNTTLRNSIEKVEAILLRDGYFITLYLRQLV